MIKITVIILGTTALGSGTVPLEFGINNANLAVAVIDILFVF